MKKFEEYCVTITKAGKVRMVEGTYGKRGALRDWKEIPAKRLPFEILAKALRSTLKPGEFAYVEHGGTVSKRPGKTAN